MLSSYPSTFAGIQVHVNDAYATSWGDVRRVYYDVRGTPIAWFDGALEHIGGLPDTAYAGDYEQRRAVPAEFTVQAFGTEVGDRTYRISAVVCSQAAVAQSMRVNMVHVLDYYPYTPTYSRNCFRFAAPTEDIVLEPGACQSVTPWEIAFDSTSWREPADITIIVWLQRIDGAREVYQAAVMNWPLTNDCNSNGIPDSCDVDCSAAGCGAFPGCGGSLDCNDNHIPDECEADCNGSGLPDDCDVASGASPDCNHNQRPDECEAGGASDCNANSVPDLCDIYSGTSLDCNGNYMPDECELTAGTSTDCQGNGILDECELLAPAIVEANDSCADAEIICPGTVYLGSTAAATVDGSAGCGSSSGTPDVWYYYEPYGNGYATFSLVGSSYDTVLSLHSGCPGTAANQLSCNDDYAGSPQSQMRNFFVRNGRHYWIRISGKSGATGDVVFTMTGPACHYSKPDCNDNGVLDDCEILACPPEDLGCQDCNRNGVLDACDIASGASLDADGDGRPDECGPTCLTGDSNCDGAVNTFDIDPFVVALTDQLAWEAAHPCDYICTNDCNGDGAVSTFDIDPFVRILTADRR